MSALELESREERPAYVRFETRPKENKAKSLEAGRSICVDVDYALITPPYSKDLVVMKVDQWLENTKKNVRDGRTPKEWFDYWSKAYDAFKRGKEAPLNGTPIKDWSSITPAQIKNLININILTVEDLAAVNDEGLRRIGMGAQEMKRKAINWLQAATDHGPLTIKVTQLETENAHLKATTEDLIEKVKILQSQLENSKQPIYAEVSRAPVEAISASDILEDAPVESAPLELTLVEQYTEKFGKKPHRLMKEETIREKLRE